MIGSTWLLLYAVLAKNPHPPSPELLNNNIVDNYEECASKAQNMWLNYWAGTDSYDKSLWTYCVYLNNKKQRFDQVYLITCNQSGECESKSK